MSRIWRVWTLRTRWFAEVYPSRWGSSPLTMPPGGAAKCAGGLRPASPLAEPGWTLRLAEGVLPLDRSEGGELLTPTDDEAMSDAPDERLVARALDEIAEHSGVEREIDRATIFYWPDDGGGRSGVLEEQTGYQTLHQTWDGEILLQLELGQRVPVWRENFDDLATALRWLRVSAEVGYRVGREV